MAEWRLLLRWFERGLSSAAIARETGLNRKRVLRALAIVRERFARAAPVPIRNLRDAGAASRRPHDSDTATEDGPRRRPTRRATMVGIYAAHGLVWAEIVPAADAIAVRQQLRERGTDAAARPVAHRYSAVVYGGRLRRLVPNSAADHSSTSFGLVESFWAFVQRQLGSRGGIRLSRLDWYLAECAWRYNRRRESPAERLRQLLTLTRRPSQASSRLALKHDLHHHENDRAAGVAWTAGRGHGASVHAED